MDEYIKREDLLELYRIDDPVLNENGHVPLPVIRQNIMDIPAADVAPVRHGRWVCVDTDTEQFFLCNRCKKKEYWESDYCPSCGCRMDLEG